MKEKDNEILERLDKIERELTKGKKEVASTVAANERMSLHPFRMKSVFKRWLLRFSIVGLIFLVVLFGVKALSPKDPVVNMESSFVEQIQSLSSLATAQAYVKAVMQKEDNQIFGKTIGKNFPGTKRKVLLIVPSSVMAGVNLENMDKEKMKINETEKTLEITLPRATIIHEPVLYLEKIQAFSQEGIFRSELDWKEGFEFAAEAKEIVIQEAVDQGLLQIAEENAVHTFTQFFENLGYETKIVFED